MGKKSCQKAVSNKIRILHEEKGNRSNEELIAEAIAHVKKSHPDCKKALTKKKK